MQSFCARVMNFCDYVIGANKLSDLDGIKRVAEDVRREAMGVSKTFYKL
jgi:lipoate synthase